MEASENQLSLEDVLNVAIKDAPKSDSVQDCIEEEPVKKKMAIKDEPKTDSAPDCIEEEPVKKKIKQEEVESEKSPSKLTLKTEVTEEEINSKIVKSETPEPEKITSLETLGPYLKGKDNSETFDYISDIPQICKDEPCMLGIDEAGRGPVLGPMVYGIAFCPLSKADHLKTLGCADSKQLSEKEREQIFDDLNVKEYAKTNIGWAIDVISPSHISSKMLGRVKVSLNEISMDSAIGLVNKAIDAGVNIAEVYVDTVGPAEKYQAKLSALFPDFQIVVAKKADSTYPIVSAASICAKVSRDHSLRVWRFREGIDTTYKNFGSGYPGDPKTKAFLEDNVDSVFGFPRIVRFSWSTAVNVLNRKAIQMDFPDVEEERDLKYKAAGSIKKFMKPDEGYVPCRFFRERCLEHCQDI